MEGSIFMQHHGELRTGSRKWAKTLFNVMATDDAIKLRQRQGYKQNRDHLI